MTSTVNESIARWLAGVRYDALTLSAGVAVVAALVALLVVKELRRIRGGDGASRGLALFDVYLVPLVITFVTIVVARLRELL